MSEQLLKQIISELQEIKTEVVGLKTDVAELKTDVAELKTDVAGLKTEQQNMGVRLDRMETDIADIKKDTSLIPFVQRAALETHSDILTMKNLQQEQQKILERLSYRSVSQEADIAELRRIK
ncbi:hypothetical protein [Paenibacillus whitsoniae]|uniref:Uncharacterized protein n=1 Tax=Paenibacillus whitsoniae TaxID=2496558 RepID=A0A3S0AA27_9BACL|nr:hypothetical protein [Paenibacillus whitsoniae]RTE08176.1 hypothetical protein EJQ19_18985 [Paenibacillus whitsoniae]